MLRYKQIRDNKMKSILSKKIIFIAFIALFIIGVAILMCIILANRNRTVFGGVQVVDTNEIVGDQDPIVSVNGVENSEYNSIKKQDDESALAAVLLCEKSLIFDGDEERMELMINDILVILEDYGAERKIYQFALVDLDNDSKTEVVLDVISVGNSGNKIILHEIDNEIYAYVVGSRTFWDLKSDGTYSFSATTLTNDGCARIVEFSESLYVEKIIMSATGSYEGADKFIINDELVTESEYENAIKNQNSKVNVIWYDFNENNIRKCFEQ